MKFTTKTEYGLICLIYMAKRESNSPMTVKEIAKNELFSIPFMEKILQKLRNKNIVKAQHGTHGGYVLARDPSEINFKEIVEALEGETFEVFCAPTKRKNIVCTHFSLCGVLPIWEKTKELLDDFYETITLDRIANNDFVTAKDSTLAKFKGVKNGTTAID